MTTASINALRPYFHRLIEHRTLSDEPFDNPTLALGHRTHQDRLPILVARVNVSTDRQKALQLDDRAVLAPYQAPNANTYAERFVRSIKHECRHRVIPRSATVISAG